MPPDFTHSTHYPAKTARPALAHVAEDGRVHPLVEHLVRAAPRAIQFTAEFGCAGWGHLASPLDWYAEEKGTYPRATYGRRFPALPAPDFGVRSPSYPLPFRPLPSCREAGMDSTERSHALTPGPNGVRHGPPTRNAIEGYVILLQGSCGRV